MPIINHEKLNTIKQKNKDPLGKCVINVAVEVMRMLDNDNTPLINGHYPTPHTPHTLICAADDNIQAGGITGSMAHFVKDVIITCHSRGEEFEKKLHIKRG